MRGAFAFALLCALSISAGAQPIVNPYMKIYNGSSLLKISPGLAFTGAGVSCAYSTLLKRNVCTIGGASTGDWVFAASAATVPTPATIHIGARDMLTLSSAANVGAKLSSPAAVGFVGTDDSVGSYLRYGSGELHIDGNLAWLNSGGTLKLFLSGGSALGLAADTGTALASGATVAPLEFVTKVSGTSTINTITVPAGIGAAPGGAIILIPTGTWALGTSGNIAAAVSATVNVPIACYWDGASKWYCK